jgi:hypothetical protein
MNGTPDGVAPGYPGDVMDRRIDGIGSMGVRVGRSLSAGVVA